MSPVFPRHLDANWRTVGRRSCQQNGGIKTGRFKLLTHTNLFNIDPLGYRGEMSAAPSTGADRGRKIAGSAEQRWHALAQFISDLLGDGYHGGEVNA